MDPKTQIEVVGVIKNGSFTIAENIAKGLKQTFPEAFLEPIIQPMLEFDWEKYLFDTKRRLRGQVWQYSSSLMCFLDGQLLGNEKDLSKWAKENWSFSFTRPQAFYLALVEDNYTKHLLKTKHPFVFMDIEIAGEAVGRLLFELFSDVCPKTSENFRALCSGERGLSPSGFPLCYRGSLFHRIVPNGWVQGGDISPDRKGDGGESIFGPTFEDESFAVPHSKRGVLGMANKGRHSNSSQFYITLQPAPWMDKTYVAFGQVVEGVEVLKRIEAAPTSNERPKYDCKVTACGVLSL